jgi:hypothetical protein
VKSKKKETYNKQTNKQMTNTKKGVPKPTTTTTPQKQQQVNNLKEDQKVGLLSRPFDIVLIGFYVVFTLSTLTIDYHNVLGPALGLSIRELQHAPKPFNWPPQFITDQVYMPWAETIDPLMLENPFFWQLMEWINVLFLLPGNLIMVVGFLFGWAKSFRTFGLIHATALAYSMVLCLGTGLYGDEMTALNPLQFFICYSLYATFPVAIITRLWSEKPFSRGIVNNKGLGEKLLQLNIAVHMIFFVAFCYHWLVIHSPFMYGLPDWYPWVEQNVIPQIPLLAKEPYATWLRQFNA